MTKKMTIKFKEGAASFYVVAFSTLILVIIAVSFTMVILSEMVRTANDELAQSAYDSALAGIEDAKLAYANYQKCKNSGATPNTSPKEDGSCGDIMYYMENPSCDMVAKILGRNDSGGEVVIEESSSTDGGVTNNMQQAYTCVKINTKLLDYSGVLTESNATQAIRVRLGDEAAKDIKTVKVSWFKEEDYQSDFRFSNIDNNGRVKFPKLRDDTMAVPPMISVGLVQTVEKFTLDQFEEAMDGRTNRGTVFLVPTGDTGIAGKDGRVADNEDKQGNYVGAYYEESKENKITATQIVKSNDRAVKNLPFVVYCSKDNDYACSATLQLPEPIGGDRSDDTFMVVVSLPYGQPSTSFVLEFCEENNSSCGKIVGDVTGESVQKPATLEGMQIEIDSTGRANNLYRRVMARLESGDTYYPYPLYGIELWGDGSGEGNLEKKPKVVKCEWQAGDWDWTSPECAK